MAQSSVRVAGRFGVQFRCPRFARRSAKDTRSAEAIELFCYQAKKWIGAYAAAMGGLDALVFSAGIGEHSAEVRARISAGLEFLGLRLDPARNDAAGASAESRTPISADESRVVVRVIPTDEEIVIARTVRTIVG